MSAPSARALEIGHGRGRHRQQDSGEEPGAAAHGGSCCAPPGAAPSACSTCTRPIRTRSPSAGTQLVPRKSLVTYKLQPGSPQWAAVLSDWRFDEPLADAIFEPLLPEGAAKIDFLKAERAVTSK